MHCGGVSDMMCGLGRALLPFFNFVWGLALALMQVRIDLSAKNRLVWLVLALSVCRIGMLIVLFWVPLILRGFVTRQHM